MIRLSFKRVLYKMFSFWRTFGGPTQSVYGWSCWMRKLCFIGRSGLFLILYAWVPLRKLNFWVGREGCASSVCVCVGVPKHRVCGCQALLRWEVTAIPAVSFFTLWKSGSRENRPCRCMGGGPMNGPPKQRSFFYLVHGRNRASFNTSRVEGWHISMFYTLFIVSR